DLTGDEDPTDEDEDIEMGDSTKEIFGNQIVMMLEAQQLDITEILEFKTSRERYENNGMSDSTGVSVSLGEISLEGNKSWESNIGDSDNTRDGGKIAGRVIITWGGRIVSYACMNSIFESSCKGKKISMSKRYLVKLFEELGEMLPGEAEKWFRMFVEEKVFSILESDGKIVE
nr:hypothetical protein [Tanacetum cinerariifolium]